MIIGLGPPSDDVARPYDIPSRKSRRPAHISSLFIIDVIAYSFLHGGWWCGGLSRGNMQDSSTDQQLSNVGHFFGVSGHELPSG
jgi:hypothetical protein